MSKSRGNVVNPQEYVDRYGSDVLRCFLMFIGPWNQGGPWDGRGIEGVARFLRRAYSPVGGGGSPGEGGPQKDGRPTPGAAQKGNKELRGVRVNTAFGAPRVPTNLLLAGTR